MTFLEKWELENPGKGYDVIPDGCPADYGYETGSDPLDQHDGCYRFPTTCTCYNCWRREIPMKKKEADRNIEYNIPSRYGYWQVSTEGDEEGKSIRNLGVFLGNIDEIAFALADKVMYTLNFEAVAPDHIPVPKEHALRINVFLCLENVSYGDSNTRANIMREMLKDTNISVKNGPGYGNVTLIRPEDPDRIKETKIKTVLNKLTDEEKELLRNYFDPSLD